MTDGRAGGAPKLGFGLMRLPRRGVAIDIEQVKRMVDIFMEAGFTYFDTAFVYPGSEAAAKKALVDRHPRESFTLATKLYAALVPSEKAAKDEFFTSLKRTGAGYFDYYLLHSLMGSNYKRYDRFRLWDFMAEQKAKGLVRHCGFSFHDGPELLDRLLTEHPEVDFVQLQVNYADWESRSVASRANYEVARAHGKPVVVMEPVKGGRLASPPAEVERLLKGCRPGMSCASWAVRFAASLDGVLTVLSGMSSVAQVEDNVSYMRGFRPLDDDERRVIQQAQRLLGGSSAVDCTACRYCTPGCPRQIAIPDIFSAMNLELGSGRRGEALAAYARTAPEGRRASDCIGCRRCEQACPQHLPVTKLLRQAAGMFEQGAAPRA